MKYPNKLTQISLTPAVALLVMVSITSLCQAHGYVVLGMDAGSNQLTSMNGSGTEADPYQISTVSQLQDMDQNLNAHYILVNDIDANATSSWNSGAGFDPVGTNEAEFRGTFDGQGYTISNLYINRPSSNFVALFGGIYDAVVKNVKLSNVDVTGSNYTGALVGIAYSRIEDVSVLSGSVSGASHVGGVTGMLESYTSSVAPVLINSFSRAAISGNDSGSLVGRMISSTVENSYGAGSVSGSSNGGLVGYGTGTVNNSFWDTEVTGLATTQVGGTGKTTAEMTTQSTYTGAGWDFSAKWQINSNENGGYPTLQPTIPFPDGDGSDSDPYHITTLEELQEVKNYPSSHFILKNDIDASATSTWNSGAGFDPAGTSTTPFTGSFNGDYHTISNLYIDRSTDDIGLFGYIGNGGSVEKLFMESVDITGYNYVGGLAGRTDGTISEVGVTGAVDAVREYGGGVIGEAAGQSVTQYAYSHATVIADLNGAGGFVGLVSAGAQLTQSYSTGSVTLESYDGSGEGGGEGGTSANVNTNSPDIAEGDIFTGFGGFVGVGADNSSSFNKCVWDKESSGESADPQLEDLKPLTTAEMKDVATFLNGGWDMQNIWQVDAEVNSGYPSFLMGAEGISSLEVTSRSIANDAEGIALQIAPELNFNSNVFVDNGDITLHKQSDDSIVETLSVSGADVVVSGSTVTFHFSSTLSASTTYYIEIPGTAFHNEYDLYFDGFSGSTAWSFTTKLFESNGTEADPYEVTTLEQLQYMSNDLSGHYRLMNDIDASATSTMNSGAGFEPVGSFENPFSGVFDGDGYTISNLFIDRAATNYVGLFGVVSGEVKKVRLEDVDITGKTVVGGLSGAIHGSVDQVFVSGAVSGSSYIGGVAGRLKVNNGSLAQLSNAYADANITGNYTGGLVGEVQTGASVSYSYATGTVPEESTGDTQDGPGGDDGSGDGDGGQKDDPTAPEKTPGYNDQITSTVSGGLVADNSGTVTASFWNTETSGMTTSAAGTGKTTAEMQDPLLYENAGWDLANTWTIQNGVNSGLPILQTSKNTEILTAQQYEPQSGQTLVPTSIEPKITFHDAVTLESGSILIKKYSDDSELHALDVNGPNVSVSGSIVTIHPPENLPEKTQFYLEISAGTFKNGDGYTYKGLSGKDTWEFTTSRFAEEGTASDPYLVSNMEQLLSLEDDLDGNYKLVNNIDASATSTMNSGQGFDPIGDDTTSFDGVLDGDGFTLSNVYINRDTTDFVGLFANLSGTVKNIRLTGLDITGRDHVGGLGGNIFGTVEQVYVEGAVNGTTNLGGLAGKLEVSNGSSANVLKTYSRVDLTGDYAGGLIAVVGAGATISNSYSAGSVPEVTPDEGGDGEDPGGGGKDGEGGEGGVEKAPGSPEQIAATVSGGLIAVNNGTVSNSYWNSETSGVSSSAAGTGLTNAQMQDQQLFETAGWDFTTVWVTIPSYNNGFPFFRMSKDLDVVQVQQLQPANGASDIQATINPVITFYEELTPVSGSIRVKKYSDDTEVMALDVTGPNVTVSNTQVTLNLPEELAANTSYYIEIPDEALVNGEGYYYGGISNKDTWQFSTVIFKADGSASDPYLISDFEQLQEVRNNLDANYQLAADIDASETATLNSGAGFDPIGTNGSGQEFSGVFDGNGYTISDLTINRSGENFVGLFGSIDGVVKNLKLENADITGGDYVGGVVGLLYGTVTDVAVKGSVSGTTNIGGIAGQLEFYSSSATIANSYSLAGVVGDNAGGLVGVVTSGANVQYSYAAGIVDSPADQEGGGEGSQKDTGTEYLIGGLIASNSGTVTSCFWDTDASELAASDGGSGTSSTSMKDRQNFSGAGWDFDGHWSMSSEINTGYPYLRYVRETFSQQVAGSEGWRILSAPISGITYGELLAHVWTQGIPKAKSESGAPNVLKWDGSEFVPPASMEEELSQGEGFIVYFYSDDDYDGTGEGFPKTLSVSALDTLAGFQVPVRAEAEAWTLAGNPFPTAMNWDQKQSTDLSNTVYVYDHGSASFKTWNGETGSLTNGKIDAFQGFWVQNAPSISDSPELIFNSNAREKSAPFYKRSATQKPGTIAFKARMEDGRESEAFLSFRHDGKWGADKRDAYKLQPLDAKPYLSMAFEEGGKQYEILNLPDSLVEEVQLPLTLSALSLDTTGSANRLKSAGGTITLTWPEIKNIPEGWNITLFDHSTQTEINLQEENSYTYQLEDSGKKVKAKARNGESPVMGPTVASKGNSALEIRITPTSESGNQAPKRVTLHQNYPNPFNPSTNIEFGLPANSNVRLEVYDLLGKRVATLENSVLEAGWHTYHFDASHLASGMYFYRLSTNQRTVVKKLTLVK